MYLLKINSNGQVTIPVKIREKLHCYGGDYLQVKVEKDGLKLVPAKIIDPTQAWFWTKEWQEKEREADEDYKAGRYKTAKNVKKFLEELHNED